MNNQIIIISGILLVTLLLPTVTADFLTLATPNAFGQQAVFDNIDKGSGRRPVWDITGNNTSSNNNNMTDYNIVTISTTTGTNDSSSVPSGNMTETTPMITVHDIINSTYIAPKDVNEDESERRIGRAIRDRINDISHTVVSSNATIISAATITNGFLDESTSINNYTRLLEIIPDQVEAALSGIKAVSQPANPTLELHTDIESVCIANNTSLANCDMNIRI
ncbi:MAG TPA: hypothetical protein VI037_06985, partial [Nitrososphaera sp.]